MTSGNIAQVLDKINYGEGRSAENGDNEKTRQLSSESSIKASGTEVVQ